MLCPSTPAAPPLARTFRQAADRVAGAYTLSIRLYQRPPLTPLPSAETMRSVQIEASTHDQSRASAPCLAVAGTAGAGSCLFPSFTHPPSYPPSLGTVLLPVPPAAVHRLGTMRVLTPGRLARARQVSPLTTPCLPGIPPPTTSWARTSLCQSHQRVRSVPGFAMHEQARRARPPNRVCSPAGCPFASDCSPPRFRRRSYLQLRMA